MKLTENISAALCRIIDLFYIAPVRRVFDLRTFRYAAAGGLNLAFGVVFYWVLFNFVLEKQDTDIFGIVTISAHILAFLINFVVTFFSGFWLTRTLAFSDSEVKSVTQLFRYSIVVAMNICINYFGLKLLVEVFGFYPTPSYMSLQIITVTVSYLASRHFTFRK